MTPPPIAFTQIPIEFLSYEQMIKTVSIGKPDTAMMSFQTLLSSLEIEAVIYFVREAFMKNNFKNTKYHTVENGWIDHDQYKIAFPFATGKILLDVADEKLSVEQLRGKQLFLSACVSCHDRGKVKEEGVIWESRPLSWPRNGYSHKLAFNQSLDAETDAVSQASVYALHDIKNVYIPSSEDERNGQLIFQNNCAFCHAPDGSGKHWIGQFILPHPKDFTQRSIQETYTKQELELIIANGKENTAMPAWRYVLSNQQIKSVIAYLWARY